jgi:hypothetical protein
MTDDSYPIEFQENSGRAIVAVDGAVNARTIQNTFLDIVANKNWQHGDKTVLWRCEKATFPGAFRFADVLETTRTTRLITDKGRTAILLTEDARTVKIVAEFYRSISSAKTERRIEIFYDYEAAVAWLDE